MKNNNNFNELINLLGLQKNQPWMMTPNERFTLLGIVNILKPNSILELGFAEGGCTSFLSKISEVIYTVDKNEKVLKSSKTMKNVIPLNMNTKEAFKFFNRKKIHFNLCIIDADHSTKGAFHDLKAAILISDVIIMHDTSNPQCRKGYELALKNRNFYFDLDLIEGHYQVDGLWGGLGIAIPNKDKKEYYLTKRYSNYPFLKRKYYFMLPFLKIKNIYNIFNYYIYRIKKKFNFNDKK